ncbi:2-polyprenyl-6-methoxyphenol hydroxylase-like FAD-dependent oxidoreductase [Novosphingobium chloroacetimidivorans]|uniref:2-polyprenyl-6-methoxyphenol hydroxylase-like FAD-dependent oxidoreductase n=1 Tax=Novosphingobium chloroacetimidivorans TaxID=1428314 RepID=A0A7W7NYK6_9SPHN|nr:FAD-dependent oxidoreductase [Novosphingobium chloroacetimidivorans]MBB4860302.1 2-polyprenyl-6-methoxyphenol hydroxylase-like FAD-dependent oxidoreductase [Novosphingobium chloroacetimidivorans]
MEGPVQIASKTQVLIVGGGPCGLMLSMELARRGVASVLVDAKLRTAINPQANATQARTMEYFRRLGFADEIRALGLPADYPTDIAYFTRYTERELARFELPTSAEAASTARDQLGGWNAAELPHRVSQKFVEEVLRRHADAEELTSIHYGVRLTGFEERDTDVIATVEDVATGETQTIEAGYLVGADGARSFVRRALGISYTGETGVSRDFFGGKMAAIYFRSSEFYDKVPHRRAWMYWAFNPDRRAWCAAVNGRDEFAFHTQLKPDESEDVSPERAKEMLAQAFGAKLEVELLSVDTWIAGHALVAESLGGGRVYIGGDAAHLFTPAGGLGYNTAVEDAVNLGWKLAATVKGLAGPALLPSYAWERRHLATRNTAYARQLAESIGNYVPDPLIEADGDAADAIRREAGEYLDGHARREFAIPGITFGGRYDGSPMIKPDGTPPPPDAMNIYVPSASPGGRLPHIWLDDGQSLFDAIGLDWSLLVTDPANNSAARFRVAAAELGLGLIVVELARPDAVELYGSGLILVRPDQIVAWRGTANEIDPLGLLRELMGHAAAAPGKTPHASSGQNDAETLLRG